jgi:uncharacterized RDD family membrane protein YckC
LSENSNVSCPVCGEDCQCRRPIFAASDWNDLEAFDISEQQFSASLEATARFVPNPEPETSLDTVEHIDVEDQAPGLAQDSPFSAETEDHSWRQELAAKLEDYRSRHRGRAPRYPSLQLKFESTDPGWSSAPVARDPFPATLQSTALDHVEPALPAEAPAPRRFQPDTSARILEFPRPTAPWLDELAGPVMERPRILEVPDVEPPPPALGGISIEPIPQAEEGKRPGIEMPMISASMARRLMAGMLDALIVVTATTLFGYIFLRIAGGLPELRLAAEITVPLAVFLWMGYQYLLLVYSGTTPGLKLAGLELSGFDGSHVPRRARRWRVLASVLSTISLGMGFLWCFVDEDQLCWHDRITHTHMAPRP